MKGMILLVIYDLVIVGGGPAGLTAAIYACRAGRNTLLIEKGTFGGQATTAHNIENYPGFPEGISGQELMTRFYKQALRFGCKFLTTEVIGFSCEEEIKVVKTIEGQIKGKTIILATGAQIKESGIKGEKEFRGKGVSYCATCDGFFFRNKEVAVVGGGEASLKEAMYLANIVKEVIIINKKDTFNADKVLIDEIIDAGNVKVYYNTIVDEIIGEKIITSLKLRNVKTEETFSVNTNGVFLHVGAQIMEESFTKNEKGFLITNEKLETSVSGVFAIGDCRQKKSRQVATAVGDGALVLAYVGEYLHTH
ncbi:MAG: FAD-dependent oxidoreductase [Clostridia bacterium]|nr:FAD-dependent oxidoreductase [Clostridia bacterium]MDD4048563.1 FAD-dependent oxidoreductase [Clostridia bacterium]